METTTEAPTSELAEYSPTAAALAAEQQRAKDAQDAEDARQRALWLEEQAKAAPAPIPMQPAGTVHQHPDPFGIPGDPAILNLGAINERLAPISVSVAGLELLGITYSATSKASRLYRESDWPRICAALVEHLQRIGGGSAA